MILLCYGLLNPEAEPGDLDKTLKLPQPENTPVPIEFTLSGITMLLIEDCAKAEYPIYVILPEVSKVIESTPVAFLNASPPIPMTSA